MARCGWIRTLPQTCLIHVPRTVVGPSDPGCTQLSPAYSGSSRTWADATNLFHQPLVVSSSMALPLL